MEFFGILKNIVEKAKENKKKIVLPEASDKRVLEAAFIAAKEGIADVILIGELEEISKKYNEMNLDINKLNIEIINPKKYDKTSSYANQLYELRKHKGVSKQDATKLLESYTYFATMLVYVGYADGMVSGAIHSTSDTLRPALQIIKAAEGVNSVSSFFLIESSNKNLGSDGSFIFSDCGLIKFPTEDELVDITLSASKSFTQFVQKKPIVALLSYSTKGSAKSDEIEKTVNVVKRLKYIQPDMQVDGELQLDSAIIPQIAKVKAPDSNAAGKANVLIFPNLEAGNIGYKIAQYFGNAMALGPITQGLKKPVNDLSRGCNTKDIVGVIAITCAQAK
ncbi:MAG: phosphate acetyltransferase [Clostridia bacterium]